MHSGVYFKLHTGVHFFEVPHLTFLAKIFKSTFSFFTSLDVKPSNQRKRAAQLDVSVNEKSCHQKNKGRSGDRHSCLTSSYNRQATWGVCICVCAVEPNPVQLSSGEQVQSFVLGCVCSSRHYSRVALYY